jgi:hypothetical protein
MKRFVKGGLPVCRLGPRRRGQAVVFVSFFYWGDAIPHTLEAGQEVGGAAYSMSKPVTLRSGVDGPIYEQLQRSLPKGLLPITCFSAVCQPCPNQ